MDLFESYLAIIEANVAWLAPACALAIPVVVSLIFGGAQRANRLLIRKQNRSLEDQWWEVKTANARLKKLESQAAVLKTLIVDHKARRADGNRRLGTKLEELAKLAEAGLVSQEQFANLLCEFVRLNLGEVDIEKALVAVKELEARQLINSQGYQRISDELLRQSFSTDLGVKAQVKSTLRKTWEQLGLQRR